MLLGNLSPTSFNFSKILEQKLIWRTCFDWLRSRNNSLACGSYKIDHGVVTAVCSNFPSDQFRGNRLHTLSSMAELHYIFEGVHKMNLRHDEESLPDQINPIGEIHAENGRGFVNLKTGDFIIFFPGESYWLPVLQENRLQIKKAVIYIPLQRIT